MGLPIGSILMWKNNAENVPIGWQVCDGTNGTPNLRELFVYGASLDGHVGSTQASAVHSHTRPATTSSDGAHTHPISASIGGSSGSISVRTTGGGVNVAGNGHGHSGISGTTGSGGAHSHPITGSTGNQTVLPPYVYLYYIMRVA